MGLTINGNLIIEPKPFMQERNINPENESTGQEPVETIAKPDSNNESEQHAQGNV